MTDHAPGFGPLQKRISKALISTTRTTTQLAAEDLTFQRAFAPAFRKQLDDEAQRLLALTRALIQTSTTGTDEELIRLRDPDDVENNWRGVVDVVDSLLEQADICLDAYTGLIKRVSSPGQEPLKHRAVATADRQKPPKPTLSHLLRNQNIAKPQRLFRASASDDGTGPWKPLLSSKPHAVVSLEESLKTFRNEDGQELFKNPYEAEIIQSRYPSSVFERVDPIPYRPFASTSAIYVDTPEQVMEMMTELRQVKELAVDLEHHDARSYVGLVSLMQISTRHQNWIVDTLKPWREDLQVLNEVFADPTILKVFHGAFMDIIWLQRDLGLYVVGLFDTFHACRVLGYPRASLASLLARFVNIEADKQYQLADWRIRPLPKELFDYARSDTHFLLHIYDHLRNQLIEMSAGSDAGESALESVFLRSQETSLQIYERFTYNVETGNGPGGWQKLLKRMPLHLTREQFSTFRAVHRWRDTIARQNDESLNYIMPNHFLFSISRAMPLDLPSLFAVANAISSPVRTRATELVSIIAIAKQDGVNGPAMLDFLTPPKLAERDVNRPEAVAGTATESVVITDPLPVAETESIRIATSSFWGPGLEGALARAQPAHTALRQGIRLALPLPPLTAEIFQDPSSGSRTNTGEERPASPTALPEHEFRKVRKPRIEDGEGVFVVKQLGGGRKRKIREVEPEPPVATPSTKKQEDVVEVASSAEDEEAQEMLERMKQKAAKKAKKKLKKEDGRKKRDAEADDGAEAFDYAKAESVLHAKRDMPVRSEKRHSQKKAFDPYSKSGDAPKGMRRAQTEKPGKSATFKT